MDRGKKIDRRDDEVFRVGRIGLTVLLRELQRREAEDMDGSVAWSVLRDMP
jgi:hypothetical protein